MSDNNKTELVVESVDELAQTFSEQLDKKISKVISDKERNQDLPIAYAKREFRLAKEYRESGYETIEKYHPSVADEEMLERENAYKRVAERVSTVEIVTAILELQEELEKINDFLSLTPKPDKRTSPKFGKKNNPIQI